ncbi:Transcription factor RAX3 [Glycine soja]|uniref:Transcription factor RAX3 n=1 Tax=Glycine soja TaxID=3848 RepID=A0A0B2RPD5_GLYSO|nr:hypothetical protein JHK87_050623 [Glycine soja]KHN34103.1 Transcription factor RAX3 [Glycine soja]
MNIGLRRCGKSYRLRWLNYLRPNIRHMEFSNKEDRIICSLYANIGIRWSIIAAQLPGRTDNDINKYWNTKLKRKLMGLLPSSHQRIAPYQQFSSQNPSSFPSHSSLSSSQYRDYYYNNSNHYYIPAPTSYFISLEPISAPSSNHRNTIKTSNSLPFYQHQERPCSSDGSCGQVSLGREIKQQDIGFQNFMFGDHQNMNKFMNINHDGGQEYVNQWTQNPNSPNQLLYHFEQPIDRHPLIPGILDIIGIRYTGGGCERFGGSTMLLSKVPLIEEGSNDNLFHHHEGSDATGGNLSSIPNAGSALFGVAIEKGLRPNFAIRPNPGEDEAKLSLPHPSLNVINLDYEAIVGQVIVPYPFIPPPSLR